MVHSPLAQLLALHLRFEVQHFWWNHGLKDPRIDDDRVVVGFALPTVEGQRLCPSQHELDRHAQLLETYTAGAMFGALGGARERMDSRLAVEPPKASDRADLSISAEHLCRTDPSVRPMADFVHTASSALQCTKMRRQVRFNFSIDFWFPGPEQLSFRNVLFADGAVTRGNVFEEGGTAHIAHAGPLPSSQLASSVLPSMFGHRHAHKGALSLDGCLPSSALGTLSPRSAPITQRASVPRPNVPVPEGFCSLEGGIPSSVPGVVRQEAPFFPLGPASVSDDIPTLPSHEGASSLEGCIPSSALSTLSSRCAPITLCETGSLQHENKAQANPL